MVDRKFSEVDLREMLEDAKGFEADVVPGRFIVHARRGRRAWHVIVEPDSRARRLVIVTAYAVEGSGNEI